MDFLSKTTSILEERKCRLSFKQDIFDLFELAIREGKLNTLRQLDESYLESEYAVLTIPNKQNNQTLFHLLTITGGSCEATRVQMAELLYNRATRKHEVSSVGKYIEAPCINNKDTWLRTPLHYAAKFRRLGLLSWFVKKNLLQSILEPDDEGMTPFHYLVKSRNESVVSIVKKMWKSIQDPYAFKGTPPLHLAAKTSSTAMVQALVEACGFDPDGYDEDGYTAFHCAIRYSDESDQALESTISRVRYLLEKTSRNYHLTKFTKDSPIHLAAMYGKPKLLEFFFNLCVDEDTGTLRVRANCQSNLSGRYDFENLKGVKIESLLISNLNAKEQSCLHVVPNHTVTKGSVDCVKVILNHPDLGYWRERERFCLQKDKNNQSVLQIAAEHETVAICREILQTLQCNARAEWLHDETLAPIYKKIPDALLPIFQTCIQPSNEYSRRQHSITMEFAPIVGDRRHLGNGVPTTKEFPETQYLQDANSLSMKIKCTIYASPVVDRFITEKLYRLKWFIIAGFIFQLVYICMFIILAYMVQDCESMRQKNGSGNASDLLLAEDCDPLEYSDVDFTLCSITIILATVFLIKEIYQMFRRHMEHFKKPSNILQLLFSVSSLFCAICLLFIDTKDVLPYKLFRVFTAGVVLLGGGLSIHELKKINWYPSFLRIFIQVAKTSATLLTYYFLLILAFTVVFKILSPQNEDYRGFQGVVKVLAMMVGEYEFEGNFKSSQASPPYDALLQNSKLVVFALFIFIAAIVGFNLLIGLAVEDIQTLKTSAQLEVLSCQVDQLFMMEEFLLSLKPILPNTLYYWMLNQINVVVCTKPKRIQLDGYYKTEFKFPVIHKT